MRALTSTSGTGEVVCLVCGSPAASRISSMLPWSAVTTRGVRSRGTRAPGVRGTRRRTRQRAPPATPDAGVAHHVGVRVVRHDEVTARLSDGDHRIGDAPALISGARSYVATSGATARAAAPHRERRLDAAVEEVGHVGVLLGLGHVELALPSRARWAGQGVDHCGGKATATRTQGSCVLGQVVTRAPGCDSRSKPAKSGSASARVSCRARSAGS